ncbi:type I-E CRISPR-associated protein Cse2/CasB [Psychromicrobium sp. YIM B11713]|uniref:type I-E CRISPR-associated protein Cse2/CasB n=1 Tax=Psychromicrobium sp. YIM B11713 TaxID=3145233 RepID=UPI00374F17D2
MSDPQEPRSVQLKRVVRKRVSELQDGYLRDRSAAVAQLAQLRSGVTKAIGEDFSLIGLTIAELYQDGDELGQEADFAERAAYAAITLYAVHQQSKRDRRMHREGGNSLGRAAGVLRVRSKNDEAVRRRFNSLATASTHEGTLHYARSLVQQFRAENISLDYVKFAEDLFWLQGTGASRVRRQWGIDFYRVPQDAGQDDED